ncbi:unnamed protein product [Alternaria alternata]
MPTASEDMPKHMHYRPSGQDFVGQQVISLYADGNWWLWAYHDVYFVQEDWVERFAIHNDLEKPIKETRTLERGSRVIKGTEVMTGATAGVGFSGWGFSMDVGADRQDKTFSSNETSEVVTSKREFDIEPKKSLIAYQKRELVYSYSSRGDEDAVIKECVQTISCDEWYFSNDKLASDTAYVTLPRPPAREPKGAICRWKNMNGALQYQIKTKYPSAAQ